MMKIMVKEKGHAVKIVSIKAQEKIHRFVAKNATTSLCAKLALSAIMIT